MTTSIAAEIAVMIGKSPDHSLTERLVALVAREVRATHAAHSAYADYLADSAHAWKEMALAAGGNIQLVD